MFKPAFFGFNVCAFDLLQCLEVKLVIQQLFLQVLYFVYGCVSQYLHSILIDDGQYINVWFELSLCMYFLLAGRDVHVQFYWIKLFISK